MTRSLRVAVFGFVIVAFATPVALHAQDEAAKAAFTVDGNLAKKGKPLWTSRGCTGCHTIGKGVLAGPDLGDVTARRDLDWLKRWLKDTDAMLDSDPIAQEMLKQFKNTRMPNLKLKDEEVDALIHFIAQESEKKKK